MVDRFLAYQMPECQDDLVFSILCGWPALTSLFLAYQMPYERTRRQRSRACMMRAQPLRPCRRAVGEPKNDFKEEANVEFQRCGPQDSRCGQGGQAHQPDGAGRQTGV